MLALLIHIYNQDSWERIFRERLKAIQELSPVILINLCLAHPGNAELISSIRNDFPEAFIITTPNKGRDIGGKLALTDFFIKDEYDRKTNVFKTTNNSKMKELISMYDLKLTDYRFVAGAMFWLRSSIVRKSFSAHSALGCREILEEGNFTDQYEGTFTHSWERIF